MVALLTPRASISEKSICSNTALRSAGRLTGVKTPSLTRAISTTEIGSESASGPSAKVSMRMSNFRARVAWSIAILAFCSEEPSIGKVGLPSVRNMTIRLGRESRLGSL